MKSIHEQALFKAEERIQLINESTSTASRIIITAYNDLLCINRPSLSQDQVFAGCIANLEAAKVRLKYALKIYECDATPELKETITSHFEQLRLNTPYLQCVASLQSQDHCGED